MSYKIGDRIKVKYEFDGVDLTDEIGTIIKLGNNNNNQVCVEFDNEFEEGHNGDGIGKSGHCRWGNEDEFILFKKKQPIDCHKLNKILCLKKATV